MRKDVKYRFKCKFCEKPTKIALKNGLNIDLGILTLINRWLKLILDQKNVVNSCTFVNLLKFHIFFT